MLRKRLACPVPVFQQPAAVSAASAKLLQAAADVLGSEAALAERLGIEERLLRSYLSDSLELPDALLLRVVDVLLGERLSPRPANLREVPQVTENVARGSGATGTDGESS